MTVLTGQLLVAMPQMLDPRFARSVVYLCAHTEGDGAMGLVVNKLLASLSMDELFTQLNLEPSAIGRARPVHFGGPVEPGRGLSGQLSQQRLRERSPNRNIPHQ